MDAIIVPCTQEKIWDVQPNAGAVPAKAAYTKAVFHAWRAYAENSGAPWFILSTKYGLIHPDQLIERYNVSVSAATGDPKFLSLLQTQGAELNLARFSRIVLLDWERFQPLVRAAVGNPDVQCVLHKIQY